MQGLSKRDPQLIKGPNIWSLRSYIIKFGSLQIFGLWSSDTDRMALGLRSARSISGRIRPGLVTDRNRINIWSARGAYGPQGI
ncbi:hypothetical protein Hanom_Chr02g00095641 [Helianthus anomalus]